MNWRPYWRVVYSFAKEDSVNPKRLIMGVAVSLFRIFLLMVIYKAAYAVNPAGLSYENAIWSLAVYFAFILNLGFRHIFTIVEKDIQSGDVEQQLIKPLDWRLVKICQLLGKNGVEFLLQVLVMPVFLILTVGLPDISFWSPLFLLGFIPLTVFAAISACYLFMTIGLFAFWLNDAKSVYRLVEKTFLIFGGGFVPIALLPVFIQQIVRFSPLGVYAAPTQALNPDIPEVLPFYLLSALFWTAFLVVLCNIIWGRAQARIEVNGG